MILPEDIVIPDGYRYGVFHPASEPIFYTEGQIDKAVFFAANAMMAVGVLAANITGRTANMWVSAIGPKDGPPPPFPVLGIFCDEEIILILAGVTIAEFELYGPKPDNAMSH